MWAYYGYDEVNYTTTPEGEALLRTLAAAHTSPVHFLARFLEHCATGTNAVTGRTGTRLDRVSFHAKGGVRTTDGHVQMDLGNQLRLHRAGFEVVAGFPAFASTPIVITEADPDGCAACSAIQRRENAYRSSPAYGAYEVAMLKRSIDLADEMGVDLRGVLTWAFTFPGSAYFAGYRELSSNGVHLPVLNAFKLLGSMSGARLPLASSGAVALSENHGERRQGAARRGRARGGGRRSHSDPRLELSRRPHRRGTGAGPLARERPAVVRRARGRDPNTRGRDARECRRRVGGARQSRDAICRPAARAAASHGNP